MGKQLSFDAEVLGMKKLIPFGLAVFFTVLAISLSWMRIGGNSSITYVHIAIPVIFGALSVKIYRKHKKAEQNDEK